MCSPAFPSRPTMEMPGFARRRQDYRRIKVAAATFLAALFFATIAFPSLEHFEIRSVVRRQPRFRLIRGRRELLGPGRGVMPATAAATVKDVQLSHTGMGCSPEYIMVHQKATTPLPNGIPTYTVHVLNVCPLDGCGIGNVHLSCGSFSSARLVNPHIFRRLRLGDCLVNDGRPILEGQAVSFQYANSFPYPLSVSSATCL